MRFLVYLFIVVSHIFSNAIVAEEIAIVQHLVDVRELQENVLPQNNSYTHHGMVVSWAGYDGASKYVCRADCSGLIDALLEHSYKIPPNNLVKWIGGANRPLARNYYRTIREQNGFIRIESIAQIRPGDFIAMEFLPGAENKDKDTGHIMVANALPVETLRNAEGARIWSIEVIDCSHGHGQTDTRYFSGKYWPGIGKGIFALYTNQNGLIIGYSWTPSEKSIFYGSDKRPLVVGRLNLLK